MAQTDIFGTFLDTLSAPRRNINPEISKGDQGASWSSRGMSDVGVETPAAGAGQAAIADLTDRLFESLVVKKRAGISNVDLSSLIPTTVRSLGSLFQALSSLESYGIVEKTGDNRISLTKFGAGLADSMSGRRDPV